MKNKLLIPILLLLFIASFFSPFFLRGKLPIPADTIVGLYHPFRDLYAHTYPNGIPYKNFLITDPVRQQYPWRWLAVTSEKKGQLPLWNPYTFAGGPLLANFQTAAFYPFNFFLFLLPFPIGWSLLIILQQLLAGLFLYWYLSHLRLNYLARFLGSFVYAFCGFMTAWMEWGTLDQVALWLPLILLSIDKVFIQSKLQKITIKDVWIWVFLLSLISAFFAGHLQPFFYLFAVSFGYFIARWVQFGHSKKILFLFAALLGCFVIITSLQWIPTTQFILQSARNVDQLNNVKQEGWFIPWQNLIQFIAPDFFGNPTTLNYWGIWNYGEFIGYVGIFPLLLAFFALFNRRDKKTFFFGTLFFLSLIFSLPTIFARIPYLLHIPFLSTSQPTRLLFLTDFSLAILTALGLDFFVTKVTKEKVRSVLYPAIFILLFFGVLWWFVLFGYKLFSFPVTLVLVSKHNLYFPTILFACVVLFMCIITFVKNKKIKTTFILLLLLLSVFDLLRFSNKFIPFVQSPYLFPSTQSLSFLQRQPGQFRIMATDSRILPPNFSVIYHLQSLDGYDPLYLQRYGELIAAIGRNKPDIHTPFGFNRIITPTTISSRLIDLFGVQYVVSLSDIHEPNLTKVYAEGQTQVYQNKKVFPRVFFVTNIKSASDKHEAISQLFDNHIDLHNTAIVEGWDKKSMKFSTGSVKIIDYQPNNVTIMTQNIEEAFLVLTDTFYSTWHVKIDSKEGKIYRTDYNFRGIVLPKGNHRVEFYDSLL